MTTEFKRADGFIVCDGCGATYSNVLQVCPQCKAGAVEEASDSAKRYLCIEKEPCPLGGEDGVCCVSCDRLHKCRKVCPTASSYGDFRLGEDDVLCEFMIVKEIGRGKEKQSEPLEETEGEELI